MSEFKYVCIPVRSEQEGIETAEDVIGTMMWNNDEHKRPQAWPYDNDNPIIVMDSPLLLEKQLAESQAETQELYRQLATELKAEHAEELAEMRAEIERKNEELDMFLAEQQAMNAEMYAVLKVCKGYFEEMGLHEDSITYKMICAALAERGEE